MRRSPAPKAVGDDQNNFRTFCETVDDLILVTDTAGRILYANSAVVTKLGYTTADLRGMHVLDFHPATDRPAAEVILAEMLRGERRYCPLPVQAKDGRWMPTETRVWRGLWDGHEALYSVLKDLSEQQAALQMFQAVFENNPTPMALSRLPERTLVIVNRAYTQITEYPKEEVQGRTSAELGLYADLRQAQAVARELEATGRILGVPITIRTKSGGQREGLFFGEVVRSQGERYFLTAMMDITSQVSSERRLREAHETLERRVLERTAELRTANALLLQEVASRRQAEHALAEHRERLRGLASQLSLTEERQRRQLAVELHDTIGQELAMARLRLQRIQDSATPDQLPHLEISLQLLDAAIGHVRDLTDNLGATVLYELGLPAALRSLGQHAAEQHALQFRYRQLGQYQRLDRDLEVQLLRASRELVCNVSKHAEASLLEITLDIADDRISVRVQDNGCGFTPQEWQKSGDCGTAGGFGLFSICEQLAVLQGHLEVESQSGAGTLATITVPALRASSSEPSRE